MYFLTNLNKLLSVLLAARRGGILLLPGFFLRWIFVPLSLAAEPEISFSDIKIGIQHSRSMIRDIQVELKMNFSGGNQPAYADSALYIWARKGERIFFWERFFKNGKLRDNERFAFNGNYSTSWKKYFDDDNPKNRNPEAIHDPKGHGKGYVWRGKHPKLQYIVPECYYAYVYDQPWEVALTNGTFKLKGSEVIRGHVCYIIEGRFHVKEGLQGVPVEAWIDPSRSYMPVRLHVYANKKCTHTYEITELRNVSDGIWYPTHGTLTLHSKSNSWLKNDQVEEFFVEQVKVNVGLGDELFTLRWEPATLVHDLIGRISYRIKPTEKEFFPFTETELDELVKSAKKKRSD